MISSVGPRLCWASLAAPAADFAEFWRRSNGPHPRLRLGGGCPQNAHVTHRRCPDRILTRRPSQTKILLVINLKTPKAPDEGAPAIGLVILVAVIIVAV